MIPIFSEIQENTYSAILEELNRKPTEKETLLYASYKNNNRYESREVIIAALKMKMSHDLCNRLMKIIASYFPNEGMHDVEKGKDNVSDFLKKADAYCR